MKKLIALILAVCCALPFVACGGTNNPNTDGSSVFNVPGENKVCINMQVYGGGVDGEWADIICEEFAKRYADTNFGGGSKKGVYFDLTRSWNITLTGLNSSNLHIITMSANGTPKAASNGGELYNLDDIVKDTTREGGSLESTIFSQVIDNLKGNDGSFYGLPYFDYYYGLQYNRKVFDEQDALIADDSDESATPYKSKFSDKIVKFTNNEGKLSKGPDGMSGTEDDGLPASMEELLVLFDYFKKVTTYYPVVVSGACLHYTGNIAQGIWAALAGQQQMQNYYNCKGEIEVVSRDANGNIEFTDENLFNGVDYIKKPKTKTIMLNDKNGYLGRDMVARFYACAFIEIMQKELWFSPETEDPGISHYDAQLALLVGKRMPRYSNSAMLCEYSYWYNESKKAGNFKKTKLVGMEESDFDVRKMPMPTSYYSADEPKAGKSSLCIANEGYFVVNKYITRDPAVEEAVLEFVKFFYSEEIIKKVNLISGFQRAIKYNLTQEEIDSMPIYSKDLWNQREVDGSNLIYNSGDTVGHLLNSKALNMDRALSGGPGVYVYNGVKRSGTVGFFNKTALTEALWKTV